MARLWPGFLAGGLVAMTSECYVNGISLTPCSTAGKFKLRFSMQDVEGNVVDSDKGRRATSRTSVSPSPIGPTGA